MINYIFAEEVELFDSFLVLLKMVRSEDYPATMVGPFEDYVLAQLGIIIDGEKEVELAERFEKYITEKGYVFDKKEDIGAKFYEVRAW